jgi:flagellar biosynthesis protein FlhF
MQVKKFEAPSIIDALRDVKKDLGPEAIILSSQEIKKSVSGPKSYIVVAAVTDTQFKKKQLAMQKLGSIFEEKVQKQSATQQKLFIENVFNGVVRQNEVRNRQVTQTRYIEIDEEVKVAAQVVAPKIETPSHSKRVKDAVQAAFKSSLNSDFLNPKVKEEIFEDENIITNVRQKSNSSSESIENMIQRLVNCGVSQDLCEFLKEQVIRELGGSRDRKALVDSWFAKWILKKAQVVDKAKSSKVEFFVGSHGSGKTTALVKLATHYVVTEQKSVAIVTTDFDKVGSIEQLRVYSRILNAPVFVVQDIDELGQKLHELKSYHKIFVDTPGISLSNMAELDSMRAIAHCETNLGKQVHLVVSALTKASDLGGLLKRFRVSDFNDVIVTNIDQTSQHGILLNILDKIGKPFHSFGIGSDIIEGFEFASRERVLDLIFKLTTKIGDRANDSRM